MVKVILASINRPRRCKTGRLLILHGWRAGSRRRPRRFEACEKGFHMAELANIRVDGARLWDSLMEMAQIGGTPKGGCKRLTLTDLDAQGRELFMRWCEEAGLHDQGRQHRQHVRPPPRHATTACRPC